MSDQTFYDKSIRNCVSVKPSWWFAMYTILHKASRTKPIIFDVQHDTSEIDGKHAIIQSHGLLLLIRWHISRLLTSAWKGYKMKGNHTLTNMLNFCHTGFICCGILWEFKQTLRTPSNKNLLLDTILMAIQLHTERNQAYYEKSIRNYGYKFSWQSSDIRQTTIHKCQVVSWYFGFHAILQKAMGNKTKCD